MSQDAASHNVFISWSGDLSKKIALAVHDWLPTVIQAVNPFVSNRDIAPGTRSSAKIAEHLRDIKIGLICVTADNQSQPWLNFEAGALSKMVDESFVIPLAFDVDKGQIRKPLGDFQAVLFTREELFHVVCTIFEALGSPPPLTLVKLERAFDLAWPSFAAAIERIKSDHAHTSLVKEPKRTTDDMLEELVVTVRNQHRLLERVLANQDDLEFGPMRMTPLSEIAGRHIQSLIVQNPDSTVAPMLRKSDSFTTGQRVFHNKFGLGTVREAYEDVGEGDQTVYVDFDESSSKRLKSSIADMAIVE